MKNFTPSILERASIYRSRSNSVISPVHEVEETSLSGIHQSGNETVRYQDREELLGVDQRQSRNHSRSWRSCKAYLPVTKWTISFTLFTLVQCIVFVALESVLFQDWQTNIRGDANATTEAKVLPAQFATVIFESLYLVVLALDAVRLKNHGPDHRDLPEQCRHVGPSRYKHDNGRGRRQYFNRHGRDQARQLDVHSATVYRIATGPRL